VTVIAHRYEPENLLQWVRNLTIGADEGVHEGFECGVEAVWAEQLRPHIAAAASLYFAGHSLGGALSVVAAARLCREMPEAAAKLRAVYTLGMPRVFTGCGAGLRQRALDDTTLGHVPA
jgi:predicted lipase